jgi:hypothetical protein
MSTLTECDPKPYSEKYNWRMVSACELEDTPLLNS